MESRASFTLWTEWVLGMVAAGALGWAAFYTLTGAALGMGGPRVFEGGVLPLVGWFVGLRLPLGLAVALMQVRLFRRWPGWGGAGPPSRGWGGYSQAGWIGGLAVFVLLVPPLPGAGWFVVGLLFGGAQWLVLRRHLRHPGWWLLANSSGLSIGTLLASTVNLALAPAPEGESINFLAAAAAGVLSQAVGMLLFGGITGGVLLWMLRWRPVAEIEEGTAEID